MTGAHVPFANDLYLFKASYFSGCPFCLEAKLPIIKSLHKIPTSPKGSALRGLGKIIPVCVAEASILALGRQSLLLSCAATSQILLGLVCLLMTLG